MTTSITDHPRRTTKKKSLINILTQFRLQKINLKSKIIAIMDLKILKIEKVAMDI